MSAVATDTICWGAVSYTHLDVYKRQHLKGEVQLNIDDLQRMTIHELRSFGRQLKVKSVTTFPKAELIKRIMEKLKEIEDLQEEMPPQPSEPKPTSETKKARKKTKTEEEQKTIEETEPVSYTHLDVYKRQL